MKIIALIVILILSVIVKILANKNKQKSDSNRKRMKEKAVEVRYEREIGIIKSIEKIETFFKRFNLTKHWKQFESKIRSEINIALTENNNIKLGKSKFGGKPDLPKNVDWFKEDNGKPLAFIAQINLRDIKNIDISKSLPEKGVLYFFYSAEQEAWGFDYKDKNKFKVYFSKETDNLETKQIPTGLSEFNMYKSCELTFSKSYSLPSLENDFVLKELNREEKDIYDLITYPEVNHKLFGYANSVQGDMELKCELVTKGLSFEDYRTFDSHKTEKFEKEKDEWKLLLQIDSDDKTEMMWGDSGRLYFWMKQKDLENLEFEKAWFILQCY
jgi:uncharacterized protein YwqG